MSNKVIVFYDMHRYKAINRKTNQSVPLPFVFLLLNKLLLNNIDKKVLIMLLQSMRCQQFMMKELTEMGYISY